MNDQRPGQCCTGSCDQGRSCPQRRPYEPVTDFLWAVATIAAACVVSVVCTTLFVWSFT